jgi:hypothetical protein
LGIGSCRATAIVSGIGDEIRVEIEVGSRSFCSGLSSLAELYNIID